MTALRYRGKGRFIVGVPATDLTSDDIARLAGPVNPAKIRVALIATGLYESVPKPTPKSAPAPEA